MRRRRKIVARRRRGELASVRCETFYLRGKARRWCESVKYIGVSKRALRIAAQTVDQGPKYAQPQHLRLIGMGDPPGFEFWAAG